MRMMSAPRRGGKTTAMLEWMREAPEGEHRVCVCFSADEAHRLMRLARDLESWQFVGPQDVKAGAWSGVLFSRGGRVVLGFDNLDMYLASQTGREVAFATWTEETA